MSRFTAKFPGRRILVAEDYFINQELTQEILEMMGCNVDIAENGKEAFEMYTDGGYDLILMDIQMPEKDGLQVTKEIRAWEGDERHTPIVALTANATTEDAEKCISAGMDEYLSKPLDMMKLEEILKKYI